MNSDTDTIDSLFGSAPSKENPSPQNSYAKTILVAEDEEKVRRLITEILGREGYNIEEAANGEEALEIALATSVDLVITDLKMPKMNGWRLLSMLRRRDLGHPRYHHDRLRARGRPEAAYQQGNRRFCNQAHRLPGLAPDGAQCLFPPIPGPHTAHSRRRR